MFLSTIISLLLPLSLPAEMPSQRAVKTKTTPTALIVYAHGRRLCSNRFRHGSATISYSQCSLTYMRERYFHRCREHSFAIRAYAMSAVGIDF